MIGFSEDVLVSGDSLLKSTNLQLLSVSGAAYNPVEADFKSFIGKTKPYFTTSRSVNDIFLDLHKKNYTTAIVKAIEIPASFNEGNDNYKLYSDIINITRNLSAAENIYSIQRLFEYKKIPGNEDDYTKLQNLANWANASLTGITGVGLNPIKIEFAKITAILNTPYLSLNADLKTQYEANFEALKTTISSNFVSFYTDYAKFDIPAITTKIDNALMSKGITGTLNSNLTASVNKVFNESLMVFLFNDKAAKGELKQSQENLLQNLRVYLPELFPDIFTFKDDNVVKLIHFVNDMAQAETSEEVENALDSFALPAGSSSIKEESKSYISINAYPGILGGVEWSSFNNEAPAGHVGITAPVGIYCQLPFWRNSGTLGLFVPVIDIGAPVRLRLDGNNDTETLPDFDFNDIFSPGLYVSYGFKNAPFAINAGIQYGPKLRGIKTTATDTAGTETTAVTDSSSFRFGIGLVIDIPLFTLSARSKN